LAEAFSVVAAIFSRRGELEQSIDSFIKAREGFTKLSSADPTNSMARDNAALMEIGLGDVLLRQGKVSQSMAQIRDAMTTFEKIESKNRYEIAGQASAYASLGRAFFSLAGQSAHRSKARRLRESQSWYGKSLNTLRQGPGLNSINPLGGDVTEQSVRQELSRCEESLTKLTSR